jgi:hypothetical protein
MPRGSFKKVGKKPQRLNGKKSNTRRIRRKSRHQRGGELPSLFSGDFLEKITQPPTTTVAQGGGELPSLYSGDFLEKITQPPTTTVVKGGTYKKQRGGDTTTAGIPDLPPPTGELNDLSTLVNYTIPSSYNSSSLIGPYFKVNSTNIGAYKAYVSVGLNSNNSIRYGLFLTQFPTGITKMMKNISEMNFSPSNPPPIIPPLGTHNSFSELPVNTPYTYNGTMFTREVNTTTPYIGNKFENGQLVPHTYYPRATVRIFYTVSWFNGVWFVSHKNLTGDGGHSNTLTLDDIADILGVSKTAGVPFTGSNGPTTTVPPAPGPPVTVQSIESSLMEVGKLINDVYQNQEIRQYITSIIAYILNLVNNPQLKTNLYKSIDNLRTSPAITSAVAEMYTLIFKKVMSEQVLLQLLATIQVQIRMLQNPNTLRRVLELYNSLAPFFTNEVKNAIEAEIKVFLSASLANTSIANPAGQITHLASQIFGNPATQAIVDSVTV